MDPITTLAVAAIAATLSYIAALGKEAAKSTDSVAGKLVWDWVQGKLTSAAGKEAVKDLENAPHDADNRRAVAVALAKLLKSDPGALSELAQLLEKASVTSAVLTANVIGDENIVSQVSGSGNIIVRGVTGRVVGIEPVDPWPQPGRREKK